MDLSKSTVYSECVVKAQSIIQQYCEQHGNLTVDITSWDYINPGRNAGTMVFSSATDSSGNTVCHGLAIIVQWYGAIAVVRYRFGRPVDNVLFYLRWNWSRWYPAGKRQYVVAPVVQGDFTLAGLKRLLHQPNAAVEYEVVPCPVTVKDMSNSKFHYQEYEAMESLTRLRDRKPYATKAVESDSTVSDTE